MFWHEKKRYSKKVLLTICCMSYGIPLLADISLAEEVEKTGSTMETITVTANKIEEDILEVPQSISVLDEAVLEEKGIKDIPDIVRQIPNMSIAEGVHGNAVSFRGLNPSMFTNKNPVVIYVDGVPIITKYGFNASLANAEQVEVLRGPQGTLYGQDAIGGVINIVTKKPDNEWHGKVGAEYGSYNTMEGTFDLNGSLVDDVFFMGLNGFYQQSDGWIENTNEGLGSAGNESDALRVSGYLLYTPTERFSARLSLAMDNTTTSWINGYVLPAGSSLSDFSRDDAEEANFDVPTYVNTDILSQSLHLSYAFDIITLTSTTTHRNQDMESDYDLDYMAGTYLDGLKQYGYTESDTYTQELRLSSNNTSGIRWVAGAYFDDESYEQGPYGMQVPAFDSTYTTLLGVYDYKADSVTDSNTYAAFAQAMIPLGERFELTLGGRYQHIDKEIELGMYYLPVGTTGPAMYSYTGDKSWDVLLPKAALSYRLSDNWNTYLSYSQGYMPGGFNYFSASGSADENTFEPQRSANYEMGIKGSMNDLQCALSLFYMDIEDIHVYKVIGGTIFLTDNAESAHSQGLELELSYRLTDTIELSGALGLIQAEYDTYDAGSGVSHDGEDIENTPSYTATAGVAWRHPGGMYSRLDLNAVGERSFYTGEQTFIKADAYITVDAKIGYQLGDWDFYVYGKNLTDEEYLVDVVSNSTVMVDYGDPLTVGGGIRYRF